VRLFRSQSSWAKSRISRCRSRRIGSREGRSFEVSFLYRHSLTFSSWRSLYILIKHLKQSNFKYFKLLKSLVTGILNILNRIAWMSKRNPSCLRRIHCKTIKRFDDFIYWSFQEDLNYPNWPIRNLLISSKTKKISWFFSTFKQTLFSKEISFSRKVEMKFARKMNF